MKHILHTILITILFINVSIAQITITNSTFPGENDTLFFKTDNLPAITISPAGENQVWDYSSLESLNTSQELYMNASTGANSGEFPNAELVTETALGETYVNITENKFEYLGYVGGDPIGLGLDLITRFSPPIVERYAPLNYLDTNDDEGSIIVPFSFDDLPGFLTDSLDLPITPDSLRVKVIINRSEEVDSWGTLTIPGGEYEVLRERRFEERESFLEAKISIFPWSDVTDLISGIAGFDFFGKDTTITYTYRSDVAKEAIAVVTVDTEDESVATRVQYKSDSEVISSNQNLVGGKPSVFAYPNPAIDFVRFECTNLEHGDYKLKIFNILGAEVWSDSFMVKNNRTLKFDLSALNKGTYLYSLVNEKGKTIATRRLMIIKP